MTAEHEQTTPLVDPKVFLDRPFQRLEVARMTKPEKPLLQWLPTISDESGIYLWSETWYVIKASSWGVPTWLMPENADVLGHSHTIDDEDEVLNDGSIPSIGDFLNASPTAKNLIFSAKGITRYWRVDDENMRRELERARDKGIYGKGTKDKYLPFLKQQGAKYEVKTWDVITDETLEKLLQK